MSAHRRPAFRGSPPGRRRAAGDHDRPRTRSAAFRLLPVALGVAPALLRVFVSAPEEQRIRRKMIQENLTLNQASKLVHKMDKQRKKYYESYTGMIWGDPSHYDLCIDTSKYTLDQAAEMIALRFEKMG